MASDTNHSEGSLGTGKAAYAAPQLTVYGSVRNLTGGSSGMASDGGGDMTMMDDTIMSDRRAKENITRIGTHALGFGLYLFEYRPAFRARYGTGRKFGVMADEVVRVVPQAVARDAGGYNRVDYARLGIALAA